VFEKQAFLGLARWGCLKIGRGLLDFWADFAGFLGANEWIEGASQLREVKK
jgi:hypothetical protein